MASIQETNPLDRLAAHFKPCKRRFSQEEYHNIEDTLSELRERQQRNPLDNLNIFFRPLAKKFEKSDYYNNEIWSSHNPFSEKIEIGNPVMISKLKSSRSDKFSIKKSTKRKRIDDHEDPSLSTTTTSSDASSSESSDEEEGYYETFPSFERDQMISQVGDDVYSTSATSTMEAKFDDYIIEDLETLSLVSDNSKIATVSRKIAKPKKQVISSNDQKSLTTCDEKLSEVTLSKNVEGEEVLWNASHSSKKIGIGKSDQEIKEKNCVPEAPIAGFTGSRAHKYLDMLDNQAFKARHKKIITKRVRGASLNSGLNSLLFGGFKPTNMLD